jgi:hypothetical protein
MHEEEEGEEHMPDRSHLKSVRATRLGTFFHVHSVAAGGGEVDCPLNSAVGAGSEPQ